MERIGHNSIENLDNHIDFNQGRSRIDCLSINRLKPNGFSKVTGVSSRTYYDSFLPDVSPNQELNQARTYMKFGNYTCKQYGLIAPRMEMGLSLYEKFFLKRYASKEAVQNSWKSIRNYKDEVPHSQKSSRILGIETYIPDLSYCLLGKKKNCIEQYDKPAIFDTRGKFDSKSARKRYKKS